LKAKAEMTGLIAITRQVSPAINQCELTHLERQPIDLQRAQAQHREYEEALRSLGVEVVSLLPMLDLPDSVFVEDAAVVLDECAIITRPGADSRRPETDLIAQVLFPFRRLFHIQAPATVDGGDVLVVGKRLFVGISSRSNQDAVEQMQGFLTPLGYTVHPVKVTGCLHLKSAVTQVGENLLLVNPAWVDRDDFPGMQFIDIDLSEPYAANAVLVGDHIIYPLAFPQTRKRLEAAGIKLVAVDASELAKAEGAVTCCSLVFKK
jgi:dimethylargininase